MIKTTRPRKQKTARRGPAVFEICWNGSRRRKFYGRWIWSRASGRRYKPPRGVKSRRRGRHARAAQGRGGLL